MQAKGFDVVIVPVHGSQARWGVGTAAALAGLASVRMDTSGLRLEPHHLCIEGRESDRLWGWASGEWGMCGRLLSKVIIKDLLKDETYKC